MIGKEFKTDLLIIKQGQHVDLNLYIGAIKKEAKKRDKDILVLDVENATEKEYIDVFMDNSKGIIVANPISPKTESFLWGKIIDNLSKDIDDFTGVSPHTNCTIEAINDMMLCDDIDVLGKDITVIGRNLGQAIADNMRNQHATVTLCHSFTKDIAYHTLGADIIINCAKAGEKILNKNMVRDDSLIIDVGWNLEGDFNNKIYHGKEIGKRNIENIFRKI